MINTLSPNVKLKLTSKCDSQGVQLNIYNR